MTLDAESPLQRTPLHSLHQRLGARMVGFAGYEMPVNYPPGIIAEHLHTRAQAGLFDVSHMGQIRLAGAGCAAALEALAPGDIEGLAPMRLRYTFLLNEAGGIIDDLMATRLADGLLLVVNAARKAADLAHLRARLRERIGSGVTVEPQEDRALLALQGPAAAAVLSRFVTSIAALPFMAAAEAMVDGEPCLITRSGYTGEDGFEISLPARSAMAFAERLLAEPEVMPVGLGARDSLRLEAGLCLWGHDIDETTTPVEAGLAWAIGKRRREEGGFPGAARILRQLAAGHGAQTRRHPPRGPRPGARTDCDCRSRRRRNRQRDERRLRPLGRRSDCDGLCHGGPCQTRHRPQSDRARHAAPGACRSTAVCPAPLSPRLNPQEEMPMSEVRSSQDHEWVRLDGDIAVIGITDYAQSQLGDVVYVELPEIGQRVEKGKEAAVVEIGQGGERSLCAGFGRGRRGQSRACRRPGQGQRRSDGRGLVPTAAPRRPQGV